MSTATTVVISAEATVGALALLAVAREAVKQPWVKFSCSVSFGILPADKRDPAPPVAATEITVPSASPAAGDRTVRPAA